MDICLMHGEVTDLRHYFIRLIKVALNNNQPYTRYCFVSRYLSSYVVYFE